jgi:hypothetical protein
MLRVCKLLPSSAHREQDMRGGGLAAAAAAAAAAAKQDSLQEKAMQVRCRNLQGFYCTFCLLNFHILVRNKGCGEKIGRKVKTNLWLVSPLVW